MHAAAATGYFTIRIRARVRGWLLEQHDKGCVDVCIYIYIYYSQIQKK